MAERTTTFRAVPATQANPTQYNENWKDQEAVNKASFGNRIIGASSFEVTDGGGLFIDIAAGRAVIGREINMESATPSVAFPASVTRWVWLKQETTYTVASGVITDTAISVEFTATSTKPAGETVRLAKVTSDGSGITEIIDLRQFGNVWEDDVYSVSGGLIVVNDADKSVKVREVRDIVEKTTDYTLTSADHNKVLTNGGASAQVIFDLPSAPIDGHIAHFAVAEAFNVRIRTSGAKPIHIGHLRTGGTGYIDSSQKSATVTLVYDATATCWRAEAHTRLWSGTNSGAQVLRVGQTRADLHLQIWRPDSMYAETLPGGRYDVDNASWPALSTGVLFLQGITLLDGDVVTNIHFFSAATALSGGNNHWFALYSYGLDLLRQTADQGAAAWAGSTEKPLALSSPYTIPDGQGGRFYLGCMVNATTVPTLQGHESRSVLNDDVPVICGRSTTGLTGTAPATAAAIANTQNIMVYAGVS